MSLRKAALAAAGCIAMQVPYGLSGDPNESGTVGAVVTHAVPADVNTDYDGYSNHWWWDNVAHFLGGYAVGHVLSRALGNRERVLKAFLVITGAWEAVEYLSRERPWHVDGDGEMHWSFDHAMEDTALDTVMGAAGAYLAATEYHGHDVFGE